MKLVQQAWDSEPQFREIISKAIDKTEFVDVTTPGADVEFSIEHGMGIIPLGYLVISQDKAAVTYKSTTAWDAGNIYLKTNVSTVALRVLVF